MKSSSSASSELERLVTSPGVDLPCTLTVESVQRWRQEVEAFFSREWKPLREMLRRTEEEIWASEGAALVETSSHDARPSVPVMSDDLAETVDEKWVSVFDEIEPALSEEDSRLTELSKKLQQQIKSAGSRRAGLEDSHS